MRSAGGWNLGGGPGPLRGPDRGLPDGCLAKQPAAVRAQAEVPPKPPARPPAPKVTTPAPVQSATPASVDRTGLSRRPRMLTNVAARGGWAIRDGGYSSLPELVRRILHDTSAAPIAEGNAPKAGGGSGSGETQANSGTVPEQAVAQPDVTSPPQPGVTSPAATPAPPAATSAPPPVTPIESEESKDAPADAEQKDDTSKSQPVNGTLRSISGAKQSIRVSGAPKTAIVTPPVTEAEETTASPSASATAAQPAAGRAFDFGDAESAPRDAVDLTGYAAMAAARNLPSAGPPKKGENLQLVIQMEGSRRLVSVGNNQAKAATRLGLESAYYLKGKSKKPFVNDEVRAFTLKFAGRDRNAVVLSVSEATYAKRNYGALPTYTQYLEKKQRERNSPGKQKQRRSGGVSVQVPGK